MNITTTSDPYTGSGCCNTGIEVYAFPSFVYIVGACHYGVALIGISINFLALVKYYSLFTKKSSSRELAIATCIRNICTKYDCEV